MTHTPLVSILIPAHNAAPWIDRALTSAVEQTWPNIEVIVVDDGSTDETASIVRRRESARLKLVRQPRRGGSAAQNTALANAQGEFIQRLDADDLLSRDKIERQMRRIADRPRAVAGGEWARFVVDPSEAVFSGVTNEDVDPLAWLVRECTGGLPMLQPGLWLAPRAVVDVAGPWGEDLTLNNDFDAFVRVLLASDVVCMTAGARVFYQSGNPASLASQRSAEAWRSSFNSIARGAGAMLSRSHAADVRRACADLFQHLAYDAYLDAPAVSREAEARATELGGSDVELDGGAALRVLRQALGWKRAMRVKSAFYQFGYGRLALVKERLRRSASAA